MRGSNLHGAAPPSAQREEEEDGGQQGISSNHPRPQLQCVPCTPAQYRRRVRMFPSWSSGPLLQICLLGKRSVFLPSFHREHFTPHLLHCSLTQLKDMAKDVVIFIFSSQEMVSPQGMAATPHQITAPHRLSPTTAG